jgi:hypothetical protein
LCIECFLINCDLYSLNPKKLATNVKKSELNEEFQISKIEFEFEGCNCSENDTLLQTLTISNRFDIKYIYQKMQRFRE